MPKRSIANQILGAGALAGLAYYMNASAVKRPINGHDVLCAGLQGAIQRAMQSNALLGGTPTDRKKDHVSSKSKKTIPLQAERVAQPLDEKNIKDADFIVVRDDADDGDPEE